MPSLRAPKLALSRPSSLALTALLGLLGIALLTLTVVQLGPALAAASAPSASAISWRAALGGPLAAAVAFLAVGVTSQAVAPSR